MSKSILIVGEFMWPWYQEALLNAFKSQKICVDTIKWFDFFWKRFPNNDLKFKSLFHKIQYVFLFGPLVNKINNELYEKAICQKPDVIFLYSATMIYNSTIIKIKQKLPSTIFCQYTNDNPFSNKRTFGIWKNFIKNIPLCDIHFIFRESDRQSYLNYGASIVKTFLPYYIEKKDYHIPLKNIPKKFHSDVVFAGHYENDGRLELLEGIIKKGYNLKLFGYGWNTRIKEKVNSPLKSLMPIQSVTGIEYNYAICGSKLALCFLSKINKDTYTRRNFEIPAMGQLLLSEFSDDLDKIFKADEEVFFFKDNKEFFTKLDLICSNEDIRIRVKKNLQDFIIKGEHSVTSRAIKILNDIEYEYGIK